jgi:rhodanese-related sulfurtransferase
VSIEEARRMQFHEEVIFVDAREIDEFEISHIANARWVGFNDFSETKLTSILQDKEQAIIIYCSIGIRSEQIGERLQKQGYTNIKNLYGGIFEWKNKNYPIVNIKKQVTDTIHAYSRHWGRFVTNGIKYIPSEH